MNAQQHTPEFFSGGFNRLADIVGMHAARLLCQRFGGRERLYIPSKRSDENILRDVIGDVKFERLAEEFGGTHIAVPKPPGPMPKKTAIMDSLLSGELTQLQIVERFDVSERYVRRIKSELRALGCKLPSPQGTSDE